MFIVKYKNQFDREIFKRSVDCSLLSVFTLNIRLTSQCLWHCASVCTCSVRIHHLDSYGSFNNVIKHRLHFTSTSLHFTHFIRRCRRRALTQSDWALDWTRRRLSPPHWRRRQKAGRRVRGSVYSTVLFFAEWRARINNTLGAQRSTAQIRGHSDATRCAEVDASAARAVFRRSLHTCTVQ